MNYKHQDTEYTTNTQIFINVLVRERPRQGLILKMAHSLSTFYRKVDQEFLKMSEFSGVCFLTVFHFTGADLHINGNFDVSACTFTIRSLEPCEIDRKTGLNYLFAAKANKL